MFGHRFSCCTSIWQRFPMAIEILHLHWNEIGIYVRNHHYLADKTSSPSRKTLLNYNVNFDFVGNGFILLERLPSLTNPNIQTFNSNMFDVDCCHVLACIELRCSVHTTKTSKIDDSLWLASHELLTLCFLVFQTHMIHVDMNLRIITFNHHLRQWRQKMHFSIMPSNISIDRMFFLFTQFLFIAYTFIVILHQFTHTIAVVLKICMCKCVWIAIKSWLPSRQLAERNRRHLSTEQIKNKNISRKLAQSRH